MKLITVEKFLLCIELELGGIFIGYSNLFFYCLQFLAALYYTQYSMSFITVLAVIIILVIYGAAFYSCVQLVKGSKMVRNYLLRRISKCVREFFFSELRLTWFSSWLLEFFLSRFRSSACFWKP